jgi:hypothetical protein
MCEFVGIAAAWVVMIAFDIVVFTATVNKTYRERKWQFCDGLPALILRDGAIYFAWGSNYSLCQLLTLLARIMTTANLMNLLTFYVSPSSS